MQSEEIRAAMREYKRQWRKKNPDKDKEYAKKAYWKNKAEQSKQEATDAEK